MEVIISYIIGGELNFYYEKLLIYLEELRLHLINRCSNVSFAPRSNSVHLIRLVAALSSAKHLSCKNFSKSEPVHAARFSLHDDFHLYSLIPSVCSVRSSATFYTLQLPRLPFYNSTPCKILCFRELPASTVPILHPMPSGTRYFNFLLEPHVVSETFVSPRTPPPGYLYFSVERNSRSQMSLPSAASYFTEKPANS